MLEDYEDDYDEETGWSSSDTDTKDPATGKVRLCKEMCSTCVFRSARAGRLKGITNDRVHDLVTRARQRDAPIVCHSTLGKEPAVCRGFNDRYSTNLMRVMGRIGGIIEVDPPSVEEKS